MGVMMSVRDLSIDGVNKHAEQADHYCASLLRIEHAANEDSWQGLFLARVFLSVVRPGWTAELFSIARLDADFQNLAFLALTVKSQKGWDSDLLDAMAVRLEARWKHKLNWFSGPRVENSRLRLF